MKDFVRDIYNTIAPVIYIMYGCYLKKTLKMENSNLYKNIICAATIISIRHYILLMLNYGQDIRGIGGNGSIITIVAIFILLLQGKHLITNKYFKYGLIIALLISDILYISRTDFVVMGIFLFVIWFCNKNKRLINLLYLTIGSLLLLTIMYIVIPQDNRENLINKFMRSFTEVSANTDEWTWETINWNWRGYETYRTEIQFNASNIYQKICGEGFGALLELDTKIKLGEYEYTQIAVLHNGYCYTLLKTGIIGVILYIITFLSIIYKRYKITIQNNKTEDVLSLAIAISLLIITYVVAGIYNGGSIIVFCLLIGNLMQIKEKQDVKEYISQNQKSDTNNEL